MSAADYESCCVSPPRPIHDNENETEALNSTSSNKVDIGRRQSLLINTGKRIGVEMDLATREANEMLLKGKHALETAGNMKKECKTTALECLQSLYETVLALSDSRSRHKTNLEKEKARSSAELIRVENEHKQIIESVHKELANELKKAREDVIQSQKTANAVKDWLSFETREPYNQIANIERIAKNLETMAKTAEKKSIKPTDGIELEQLRRDNADIRISMEKMSNQLDEMRRLHVKTQEKTTAIWTSTKQTLEHLRAQPAPQFDRHTEDHTHIKSQLGTIITEIKTHQTHRATQDKEPFPPLSTLITKDHLKPITEGLEAVTSELKTLKYEKRLIAAAAPTLDQEIAQAAKIKKTSTYAKATAKPPPLPKPNHTLIITSTDPQNTSDKVIEKIRNALDTKSTGARVDQVRKGRNQKVIIRCNTREDLNLVHTRVRLDKNLKAEVAKAGNPQIIIRDVLSYLKDSEIVQNILVQNKHLLSGVDMKESTVKVKYRKRARNPHECHPILELSPTIYQRFLEAGKVYIGLQRRPVADHSPLVQCTRCLGFGHTKKLCQEKDDLCSHCGGIHSWDKCKKRIDGCPPVCINCVEAKTRDINVEHNAFSMECSERARWDAIARSKISYC